jgi:dipeptidyl-peptidase-4
MPKFKTISSAILLIASALNAAAQAPPQLPSKAFTETLKAEFEKRDYRSKYPEESQWKDNGASYTMLEPSAADKTQRDLVAYDTATGKRTILVPAKEFIPTGVKDPLSLDEYTWSPDNSLLLIFTNSKKVWRRNTRGDYWILRLSDGKLTQLGKSLPASSLMFAKLSPDSKSVAYVSKNNIYSEDLATNTILQLTHDGSLEIINGTTDWVTEEELDLRDAFRWSPDSKSIAYWQFDQSRVGEYTLINDVKSNYPQTFEYKYPQPGGTNSSVRVGVIPAAGGTTTWIKLPGDPRNNYIPRMEWVPNSHQLVLQYLNRLQNDNQVYLSNPATGEAHMFFEDKDPAWVDIVDKFEWVSNKSGTQDFLWLSERDGWTHAYLVTPAGETRLITNFAADVISEVSLDETGGYFYFIASPGNPTQRYLYRSRLDGTGTPEQLTPSEQPGTHSYDVAPGGKYAIASWSSACHPPEFNLIELSTHKLIRPIVDNHELIAKENAIDPNPVEFLETPVSNDVKLSTFVVKPPNFDPHKKYPVIVYVYSEPAATTVNDNWSYTFDKIMAREGYVILSFDNQGTPAPKGRNWRKVIYGDIGVLSSKQQHEAIIEFAKEHPWIDTTRIGMYGHSGGGSATLNQIFRYPGFLAAGVAIAPMADQLLYDTVYQERYMGLPSTNARGYHDGSPINFAANLADPLLIIHGSGDDNVHFQGTEMLVDKLVAAGKPFQFMDYPNRTHALSEGKGTLEHRFTLMLNFFETHMPPGPR